MAEATLQASGHLFVLNFSQLTDDITRQAAGVKTTKEFFDLQKKWRVVALGP